MKLQVHQEQISTIVKLYMFLKQLYFKLKPNLLVFSMPFSYKLCILTKKKSNPYLSHILQITRNLEGKYTTSVKGTNHM